jgi:pyruvate/2-oxoglutarate/acetoin dehydrogenase E1 component
MRQTERLLFEIEGPIPPLGAVSAPTPHSPPLEEATRACEEELADLSVELVDMRTLVPLDLDTAAASVAKTGRALVVHEAVESFGPGAEIAMRLTERLLFEIEGPIRRLGAVTAPTPYSPPLEEAALPAAGSIAAATRELLEI